MNIWILYREHILNIRDDGLTPCCYCKHRHLLLVCWSGVYWVRVGIGLCDVLSCYVGQGV